MPSTIIPTLRYRDAASMIPWLCSVFGFERHLIVEQDGVIEHAQLTLGQSMIMIGSDTSDEFSKWQKSPAKLGGTTQSPYIVVGDADAVLERAVAHGAEITMPIKDEDYGGRGFSCRDPEGHLWNVGTYNPWSPPRT